MKITRDVVSDLLPAYESGEASADTRALVDEMAAQDPDIARLVESARHERSHPMLQHAVNVPPDLERQIVDRTRSLLYRRSWILALAIVFTVLPFTFGFHDGHITFLLMRERGSRLFWVVAAFLWYDYILLGRRLGMGSLWKSKK